MAKMTTEEAFVKVLQMHGIENAFGIIGSAFMPISDLFPKAGITFWDVAHESNGGLIADGYTRSTGKIAMCIAQNGPGITGLVTPIKTAYWNHTPMLLVTPQAANKTIGQGGFQEVEQMNLFKDMVCYQEEVRDPSRMAEVLNRVIEKAIRGSAPAQINVPRDYWTQVIDIELPSIVRLERQAGGASAVAEAAKLLSNSKFPVILSGAGVVIALSMNAWGGSQFFLIILALFFLVLPFFRNDKKFIVYSAAVFIFSALVVLSQIDPGSFNSHIINGYLEPHFWTRKFNTRQEDVQFVKMILKKAGI